jgi:hypothetical protein
LGGELNQPAAMLTTFTPDLIKPAAMLSIFDVLLHAFFAAREAGGFSGVPEGRFAVPT